MAGEVTKGKEGETGRAPATNITTAQSSSESQKAKIVDFLRLGKIELAADALNRSAPDERKGMVIEVLKLLREEFKADAPKIEIALRLTDEDFQKHIPSGGDCACPKCNSKKITAANVEDVAFSIHYVDDKADFTCCQCGNEWNGQYGYRGLA